MNLTIPELLEMLEDARRREEALSVCIGQQASKIADLTSELSFVSTRYHSVLNTLRTAEEDLTTFLRNQG